MKNQRISSLYKGNFYKIKIKEYDWIIFFSVLVLMGANLFHLYTLTFPSKGYYFFRQITWVGIGTSLLFLFSFLKVDLWKKIAYVFYGITIILLIVVLFKGKGVYGARRWLEVGTFSIQPSELAKLSLVFVISRLISAKNIGWREVIFSFGITFVFLILIAKQPDLGSALIFPLLWIGMLFLAGLSWKKVLTIIGSILCFFPLLYFFLRPYQKVRILTFLNPGRDPLGAGWSSLQSKITLGSGRLVGKGMGKALHSQLKFLPQPFTDFIFATVGEQWGFIGALFILGLYFIIIFKALKLSKNNGQTFAGLVSGGISILIFLQVFINVGMTAGIMPVTGIPLPLLSYGGSSAITFLAEIGILLAIKKEKSLSPSTG